MNEEFYGFEQTELHQDSCEIVPCEGALSWLVNFALKVGAACLVKAIVDALDL